MATIQVQCNSHVLTVVNTPVLAAGSVGVDKIQFEFDSEWSSYGKEAVFWKRSTPDALYRAAIGAENTCVIPSTVLDEKGVFLFVARGTSGEDVITTTAITYDVENGIVGEGIDPPAAPEQSVYDQILETVNTFSQKFDEQTGVYNNVIANLNTTVANKVAVYIGKIDAAEANAAHDHYSYEMEILEGSDSSFDVTSIDHVTATTVMAASIPAGKYKVTCCLQDIQYEDYVHSFQWALCYSDNTNDHVIEERGFSVRSAGTNITIETLLDLDAAQNIYIRWHEQTATNASIQFDVPFTLTFEQMNEIKDPEIVDARGSSDTLKARLDEADTQVQNMLVSMLGIVAQIGNLNYTDASLINVLPFSTLASGELYKPGHGYAENMNLSDADGTEMADTGMFVTGFIPIRLNDVIRLSGFNVVAKEGNTGAENCKIAVYDSNFVLVDIGAAYKWLPKAYNDNYVGEDGLLQRLKVSSGANENSFTLMKIRYVRISGNGITGTPSISISNAPEEEETT